MSPNQPDIIGATYHSQPGQVNVRWGWLGVWVAHYLHSGQKSSQQSAGLIEGKKKDKVAPLTVAADICDELASDSSPQMPKITHIC